MINVAASGTEGNGIPRASAFTALCPKVVPFTYITKVQKSAGIRLKIQKDMLGTVDWLTQLLFGSSPFESKATMKSTFLAGTIRGLRGTVSLFSLPST